MSLTPRSDWPPQFLATSVTSAPLLEGDAGTAQTIRRMRWLIDRAKKDPLFQQWIAYLLRATNVPPFDWMGEIRAFFNAARSGVRYTRDPVGKEVLRAPRETLLLGIGDCDDLTMLMCAAAESVGAQCRIVTISQAGMPPLPDLPEWTHVYPEANVDGRWIALDLARKHPRFGAQPRHFTRRAIWSTWDDSAEEQPRRSTMSVYTTQPFPSDARTVVSAAGLGRARRSRRLRMGLGIDATDLSTILGTSTTGIANIITASRANPLNLVPATGGVSPTSLTPAAQAALYESGAVASPLSSISSSWLLWGALGLGAVLLISRARS